MCVLSHFSHVQLCDPMDCSQAPPSMGFSRQEYWSGLPCPPPGDLLNPGIEPRSPTLHADYLPSKLPGKPMNTGMGSVSLLQWIFPTQESNLCLLHCRRILHQLSYQGIPSGFPYFLQFGPEIRNKELMIRAILTSQSCFC